MLQGKKVLFFDMDGTLIDSVGIWNQVDQTLIRRLGAQAPADQGLIHRLGAQAPAEAQGQALRDQALRDFAGSKDPYLEYCALLKARCGSALRPEAIHSLRYEIAQDFLVRRVDYKPGADKALALLKALGFTLAITSTTKRSNMDIYREKNQNIRQKAPLDDFFSRIYTREDVGEIKPSPEVYHLAMAHFQVNPEDCLIFEDSLVGVEAAAAAGISAAALYDAHSDQDQDKIRARAQYFFSDYPALIAAIQTEFPA